MNTLFDQQVSHLSLGHFLLLLWAAHAEDQRVKYNITNFFDDLKQCGITRTKQNAVALVDALRALRFVDVRDEGNRKNLYITKYGAQALQALTLDGFYRPCTSAFLEGH